MSISSPSARPHSKSLFRGTVEMPQKALCGEFYQSTCNVLPCVFRAYNAPYNAFVSVRNVPRTSAETVLNSLSPSAALYRNSAVEYLLIFQPRIGVSAMPDWYAQNAPLHVC